MGKRIAETRCSSCHVTDNNAYKGVDIVPTFPSIAKMNSTTEDSPFVFFTTPQGEMPSLVLSRQQIHDVSAHILSLRSSKSP